MKDKRAVSDIVITVLLILVAITAVALVAAFLIPFIKGSLNESGDCFSLLGKTEIVAGDFTCYNSSAGEVKVMIKRGYSSEDVELDGYAVVVSGGGESDSFNVKSSEGREIPNEGELKTYTFNTTISVDAIDVSPILKSGKVCEGVTIGSVPACQAA